MKYHKIHPYIMYHTSLHIDSKWFASQQNACYAFE